MLKPISLILVATAFILTAGRSQAQVHRQYASGAVLHVGYAGSAFYNPNTGATAYRYRGPHGGLHTAYSNPTTGVVAARSRGIYGRSAGYVVNTNTGNGAAYGVGYRGAYGVRWW